MPENKKEQVLSVRDLDITFKTTAGPVHAIRGVNIDLYKGETVALVGESGSGKSVTMKAAMGILAKNATVNSGSIQFSYHHADGSPETVDLLQKDKKWIRRHINGKRIAMVFQDPMTSLDPTMTIGKQIMEGMLWHFKMPKAEAYKKALELLEEVGITDAEKRMKNYPHQLSGGMRQRVVIAIALACNPKLLLADRGCPFFKRRSFFTPYADELRRTDGLAARELCDYVTAYTDFPLELLLVSLLKTQPLSALAQNLHWCYPVGAPTGETPDLNELGLRLLHYEQPAADPVTDWYNRQAAANADTLLAEAATLFEKNPMLGVLSPSLPLWQGCTAARRAEHRQQQRLAVGKVIRLLPCGVLAVNLARKAPYPVCIFSRIHNRSAAGRNKKIRAVFRVFNTAKIWGKRYRNQLVLFAAFQYFRGYYRNAKRIVPKPILYRNCNFISLKKICDTYSVFKLFANRV